MSNDSAMGALVDQHKGSQTDRTDSITSTADTGGTSNNNSPKKGNVIALTSLVFFHIAFSNIEQMPYTVIHTLNKPCKSL